MSRISLVNLKQLPVYQNKMYNSALEARQCPRGDVELTHDTITGLVSNTAFEAEKLQYDSSYQNEQGHSDIFKQHLEEVLGIIGRHFRSAKLLEIGCGKGDFLDRLRQAGHDAWGVDPAYEGDSPYITKQHFTAGSDLRGDAIVMRHVLEHIPDPFHFLKVTQGANDGRGLIYIEVPCFDWILRHKAWFDIFYEHVNYFRIVDFERMFGRVLASGHVFGGQYLYVVADLASLRSPSLAGEAERIELPPGFFASIEKHRRGQLATVQSVIWGAAAKGVMFAHHMQAGRFELDFAIDINPAKQGKFLAGSGLGVLPPERGLGLLKTGANIFVMNSNYLAEIRAMGGDEFNYIELDEP